MTTVISDFMNAAATTVAASPIGVEAIIFGIFMLSWVLWSTIHEYLNRPKGKTIQVEVGESGKLGSAEHLLKQREQIIEMLNSKEFTRALNRWRSVERDGLVPEFPITDQFFEVFLLHAIRVGKVDVFERLFEQFHGVKSASSISAHSWQMVVKMLASRRQFSTLIKVWKIWGEGLPNDKVVFSCLINAALESGDAAEAKLMLPQYRASEEELLPREYNTFFRTYAALSDASSAIELYQDMLNMGVSVETLLFNILLLTCVKAGETAKAHTILHEAVAEQNELVACDVVSFNTVLKGYAQVGQTVKCVEILDLMAQARVQADEVTNSTVLDSCLADEDVESALEMVKARNINSNGTPAVLIKGFLRAGRMDRALQCYAEWGCLALDRGTAAQLVRGLTQAKEVDKALALVRDMATHGFKIDDVIMTNLLDGCWQTGALATGEQVFAEMLKAGIVPSEYTLIAMLKLYARAQKLEESLTLLATWKSQFGKEPSVIHYTCFMAGACRAKQVRSAWRCYEMMVAAGIKSDEHTVRTLLPALCAAQLWVEAVQLAHNGILIMGAATRTELLNDLLDGLLRHGLVAPEGHQVFQLMTECGVPVKVRNARRRLGLPETADGRKWQ